LWVSALTTTLNSALQWLQVRSMNSATIAFGSLAPILMLAGGSTLTGSGQPDWASTSRRVY
jgi:hypothetical protein